MSKFCEICGKGPHAGRSIIRRGMAKKKGGVGRKTTGITARRFLPNLQSVKIVLDGTRTTARVCTACIRSGNITKAA
ncbi:MAG: 50S ribosomal protein L28 [Candidatus Omnitrophica bacterium]|nr:50S ribosomal protein L28 [Candidatus Omnitrophota bacterium]